MVVPGGVDRSGECRVIPALLALIERLALHNDVQVIALSQEVHPDTWELVGARIHNIGVRYTRTRSIHTIYELHRAARFDVVHAIWSGNCGLAAAAAGRLLGIPSLVHIAGGELVSMPDIGYGGVQTWRGRLREALVLRHVSAVTAASAPVIDALFRRGISAHRVPLGVDLKSWPPREPARRDQGKPARLIHVASLNRVKDQSTLLRALAALMGSGMQFEMDLVGGDTLQGEIQALAGRLRLSERVRFQGFLPQRQLRPLVDAADIIVHSSRHEAGPLAILEAAVAGVPTVGTMVGHIAEWAPGAAISVPVGDWSRLAAAVRQLIEDEELRLRIAREAHKRAILEDADYTARRFRELYGQLV